MTTRRQAILHIGAEKTGTTTIQGALAASRAALVAAGFAYPRAPGEQNHVRLAIHAGRPELVDDLARDFAVRGGAEGSRRDLAAELAAELAALPASVHTVLLSNEHCHSRLRGVEEVLRLKSLLDGLFAEVRVIVYLRRQDELAISHYTTALRGGAIHDNPLPPPWREPPSYFDWDALLTRWSAVFGRAAVTPRLFSRQAMPGGDVVRDFAAACGLPPLQRPAGGQDLNVSLSPAAQELLRRANLLLREGRLDRRLGLGGVGALLAAREAGAGRMPSRAEAEAFMRGFAEGNERVRATWFPAAPGLFPEGFDAYPEAPTPPPTDAEVLDLALGLLAAFDRGPGRG